ncbi:MAG: hypothetical protein AAF604_15535 [Acidobacteriota bacterium]
MSCFLLLFALAASLSAQSQAVEAPLSGAATVEVFEALPTRSGLLLRPRADDASVRAIEIIGDQVAIDGEDVDRDELEERLGPLAAPVLELLGQSPRERRVTLGLESPPAPEPLAEAAAVPVEADEEEVAAADEPVVDETSESDRDAVVRDRDREGSRRSSRVDLGQRVSLGSGVKVRAEEYAEQAIAIGGKVTVDGEVEQDVLAVGGSVHVDGQVGGEVVSVGGSVYLGSDADVEGNVTSVGGRVRRESGSQVGGVVSEVSMARFFGGSGFSTDFDREERRHSYSGRSRRFGDFFGQVLWAFFVTILVWICGIVASRPLERVEQKLRTEPGQSALAGFLAEILIVPLAVVAALILVISVIGIPLLVLLPVVGFLFAIGMLFGYAASARWLADRLAERFGWSLGSGFKACLVGVGALHIWMILGTFLSFLGGPAEFFGIILIFFGAVVQYIAVTAGLGAVILTRFGAGPKASTAVTAPPIPPVPPPFEPLSPIAPPEDDLFSTSEGDRGDDDPDDDPPSDEPPPRAEPSDDGSESTAVGETDLGSGGDDPPEKGDPDDGTSGAEGSEADPSPGDGEPAEEEGDDRRSD